MKIGISQIKNKAPQWMRITRNALVVLKPATVTYLSLFAKITPAFLVMFGGTLDYLCAVLVGLCIFSGVNVEEPTNQSDGQV